MRNIIYSLLFVLVIGAGLSVSGQSAASLKGLCPNSGVYATIKIDQVGNQVLTPCATQAIKATDTSQTAQFGLTAKPSSGAGDILFGDCSITLTACVEVYEQSNRIFLGSQSDTGTTKINLVGVNSYTLQRTITSAGTTGNADINKPAGTLNAAALATDIALTNSLITEDSVILYTLRTLDASCTRIDNVTQTSGNVVFTFNAACTAETSIGFLVLN